MTAIFLVLCVIGVTPCLIGSILVQIKKELQKMNNRPAMKRLLFELHACYLLGEILLFSILGITKEFLYASLFVYGFMWFAVGGALLITYIADKFFEEDMK